MGIVESLCCFVVVCFLEGISEKKEKRKMKRKEFKLSCGACGLFHNVLIEYNQFGFDVICVNTSTHYSLETLAQDMFNVAMSSDCLSEEKNRKKMLSLQVSIASISCRVIDIEKGRYQ